MACGKRKISMGDDKMFCGNCGKEIANESRFCGECGAVNRHFGEINENPAEKAPPAKRKRKKLWGVISIVVAVCLLVGYLIYDSNRIKLKYDWGIGQEEILEDGGKISLADSDDVMVDDEEHEVDRIKEFEISGDVEYRFIDNELVSIYYAFHEYKWTFEEMLEIVAGYYGDDYYLIGGYEAFWWKDGTVVRLLDVGNMIYWSEDQFLKGYAANSSEVIEYFEK